MDTLIKFMFAASVLFVAFAIFAYVVTRNTKVFVAVVLPWQDGTGRTEVLGAYHKIELAQSKLFDHIGTTGQPCMVVPCPIGKDLVLDG